MIRTFLIIIILIFFFQKSNGQDSTRHFEIGSTLITLKSNYGFHDLFFSKPTTKFINGLFFRYTKKRFGIRVLASYSQNSLSYTSPPNVSEGVDGDINTKNFGIGVGGQFSLIKKKECLYAFADFLYRNIFSKGHTSGGYFGGSDYVTSRTNGLDSFFGLGFKIKTFKRIYISPEVAYNVFCGKVISTVTPHQIHLEKKILRIIQIK